MPKFPVQQLVGLSAEVLQTGRQYLLHRFSELEAKALLEPQAVVSELVLLRQCFQDDPCSLWASAGRELQRLSKNTRRRHDAQATWKDLGEIAASITGFLDAWISHAPSDRTVHAFLLQLERQQMLLAAGIEVEQAAWGYTAALR